VDVGIGDQDVREKRLKTNVSQSCSLEQTLGNALRFLFSRRSWHPITSRQKCFQGATLGNTLGNKHSFPSHAGHCGQNADSMLKTTTHVENICKMSILV